MLRSRKIQQLHYVKTTYLLLAIISLHTGCDSASSIPYVPHRVITVDDQDEAMNAAVAKAKETFPKFEQRWKFTSRDSCSIKFAMNTDTDRIEHIWFTPIRIDQDRITARCANDPKNIPNLKYGDVRILDRSAVSDWMIIEGRKCYGGYTIRVLAEMDSTNAPPLEFVELPEDGEK